MEKMFFFEKNIFPKRFSPNFFFKKYYVIWDPGGCRRQTDSIVASGMSFQSVYVLKKSSNSTICQKYDKNTVFDPS